MPLFGHHDLEILDLRSRALTSLVDNYQKLFHCQDDLLDLIPKPLRKEIFRRLVHKGNLQLPLMRRIVDNAMTLLDLRSVGGDVNADCCGIVKHFTNLNTLFATRITASSQSMCDMFSSLHKLSSVDISYSPSLDDAVVRSMAENCPSLRLVCLRGTNITDKGLAAFGENSLSLIGLDISFTEVSKVGMDQLMKSPTGHTLKELKCRKSRISSREDILSTVMGFRNLEDYSFTFDSSDDANWVLSRVHTTRLKNLAFNIPL